MPIVISRNAGEIHSSKNLEPGQSQTAWEMILKTYLQKHPEALSDKK